MKLTAKNTWICALSVICVVLLMVAAFAPFGQSDVYAENEQNVGRTYYYEELNDLSKKFYDLLAKLEKDGEFKDGQVAYNLVENNVISADDVEEYVKNGKYDVPVAFSAARDAYFIENPSLFYIDVYKLAFSAGKRGGQWVALIDTGNYDNCYHDNGFTSETEVDNAIESYTAKLNAAVASASSGATLQDKVTAANAWIVNNVSYNYEAYNTITNGEQSSSQSVALSGTAYGVLVTGNAVCAGYSRAFKAIMDEMNIPTVCVQGYSRRPSNDTAEPHMWNYVKMDDGKWYAVDTTWNDTGSTPATSKAKAQSAAAIAFLTQRYLLVGSYKFAADHSNDGVISSSEFELFYPTLADYDYGTTEHDNGFAIDDDNYVTSGEGNDKVAMLYITVSYKGMGAAKLEEQGLYMAFRYEYKDYITKEWTTSSWSQITKYPAGFEITDTSVQLACTTEMTNVQFAVFNKEADGRPTQYGPVAYDYNPATLNVAEILVDSTDPICNKAYGTYVAPPYPMVFTPVNTTVLDHGTYEIKIVYDETLKIADESKPAGIRVSTVFNDMEGKYTLEDFKLGEDGKTVSFTFTPSLMYHHNMAHYSFFLDNIVGEDSEKMPIAAGYVFNYPMPAYQKFNYTCNPYGYCKVYGQPQLISDENLAEAGFKDVLGTEHKYDTDQRAQVLLVVTKPDDAQTDKMEQLLTDKTDVNKSDVKTTATYEIDMNICGGACKQVPDGWKLQMGVGFPYKDFDYNDTSIVYKAYHYKRDANGTVISIEEISCIVTPLGLIIDVDGFSPFMIVALDANSQAAKNTQKQIFANKLSEGGKISESVSGKNNIFQVNGSITYNLQPDAGYKVDKVTLNGKLVEASKYANGSLTLQASELSANNTLDVTFIKDSVAERYSESSITVEAPATIVVKDSATLKANAAAHADAYVPTNTPDNFSFVKENPDYVPVNGNNPDVGLIIGIVIACVVVVAAAAVVAFMLIKRKNAQNNK